MSFWTAPLSPDCAASASGLRRLCAAVAPIRQVRSRAVKPTRRRPRIRSLLEKLGEWPGAVSLLVLFDPVQLQHADKQVSRRNRLPFVREMAVSAQPEVLAADQVMRHIVVLVLVGVPHVRPVHDDGVVEQGAVAFTN